MRFFRELHFFSRKALKGHYAAAWCASMLRLTVWLGAGLVPAVLAAVLIRRGVLLPAELFSRRLWVLFTVLWSLAVFCIRLPVQCGTRSWFTQLVELEMPGQERRFFRTPGAYCRGAYFFGTVEILRYLAALPLVGAGLLTVLAVQQSSGLTEGGFWLFAAVQGLTAVFWAACLYVRFCISLAAVPYLFLMDPHRSVFGAVRASRRMLAGQHRRLWALLLSYAAASLPVVTVPFLLPCLMTDMTLFLQLRIREYAQEESVR